jgi:hypothetical protein
VFLYSCFGSRRLSVRPSVSFVLTKGLLSALASRFWQSCFVVVILPIGLLQCPFRGSFGFGRGWGGGGEPERSVCLGAEAERRCVCQGIGPRGLPEGKVRPQDGMVRQQGVGSGRPGSVLGRGGGGEEVSTSEFLSECGTGTRIGTSFDSTVFLLLLCTSVRTSGSLCLERQEL